jgi:uncharacterized repeat protein (TIGR03803 family)
MKTHSNNLLLMPVLIAGFGLILADRLTAQTFTTLHTFTAVEPSTLINSDGAAPRAGLILSANTLYGTATYGGSSGNGTVFALNTDGTGFTTLHSFTGSDGARPGAGLILWGNTLYGTAGQGGTSGNGTVFAVNTDGSGFTTLYRFTGGSDGAFPNAGLILSDNTLYGTATGGGSSGSGTVFALKTDGTGYTTLYSFTAFDSYSRNSDGAWPAAGLILSGDTLYGTANYAGVWSYMGTLFKVKTDGTDFMNLHNFTGGSDGGRPVAGLIISGNSLYGTASEFGGSGGEGTVFKINSDGTGFTTLHSFTTSAYPDAGLILSGNTLYGTATGGGSSGKGMVFAVNTDGTGFTNLYSFTAAFGSPQANMDGSYPVAGLILSGNILYGTARSGGTSGSGTIFSLSLPIAPPLLTIIPSGANVILTWPTNAAGFTLQSTTNLGSSAVWTTNSPVPVVVNGQNTVTNPISGSQEFFRLSQ